MNISYNFDFFYLFIKKLIFKMLSLEIEPYQDHDDDADADLVGDDSLPQQAVPTHSMILDGVLTMPGSGMDGDDEYGEEVIDGVEFSKIKRE